MERFSQTLLWLHSPSLVVKIQQWMGVMRNDENQNETIGRDLYLTRKLKAEKKRDEDSARSLRSRSNGLTSRASRSVTKALTTDDVGKASPAARELSSDTSDCPSDSGDVEGYQIRYKSLYYLFLFGAGLGNELFYISFFPFWQWNVDGSVCRRVLLVWAFIMFVGQACKDVICWPRPASPPVVRLETRYELEYGMPSTHAMVGAAVPFSLLIFTMYRYEYNFWYAAIAAFVWCGLVCLSRIYMGMHSVLDVIAGLLLVTLLMFVFLPWVDVVDEFQLRHPYSPLVMVTTPFLLALCYPTPNVWSTARGDTTMVLGSSAGVSLSSWINYQLGIIREEPDGKPPPYSIIWPTFHDHGLMLLRTSIGIVILVATRAMLKILSHAIVCYIFNIDRKDERQHRRLVIELPIKFFTYLGMAIQAIFLSPRVFHILNIDRATWYTEV